MTLFFMCFTTMIITKPIKILSKTQWREMHTLLVHPAITPMMRKKLNSVIYTSFENWAIKKAYEFKALHRYKCRGITAHELSIYACKGLLDATARYNPYHVYNSTWPFLTFANMYVRSNLYKGLTDLHPLSKIHKRERIKRKHERYTEINKRALNTKFVGKDDWLFEKNKIEERHHHPIFVRDEYVRFWNAINQLPPSLRKIMHLKYSFEFDQIRSNRHIAELMACSEEHVRFQVKQALAQYSSILFYSD